jgi:hypothetical protein
MPIPGPPVLEILNFKSGKKRHIGRAPGRNRFNLLLELYEDLMPEVTDIGSVGLLRRNQVKTTWMENQPKA